MWQRGITLALAGLAAAGTAVAARRPDARSCPHFGRPAVAADRAPGALRVFAIQFEPRFRGLRNQLGRAFVAATDQFVRVFMTTMASEALKYGVYLVASNTQSPFRLTRDPRAGAALSDPGGPRPKAVFVPTAGVAYDQTFLWGPRTTHPRAPAPRANLITVNRKLPLTSFEAALGFAPGPARGAAARANLRPVGIPGTKARLGFATSLPAFTYGTATRGHECNDVAATYMRCLDRLGANVVIQADANDGEWTGLDGSDAAERWQPLAWMGSAWRAVSDPGVRFAYAVNPFMVGNLSDTPFDGQSAILERGRRGRGCHYVGDGSFVPGEDDPALRGYAGSKPQFLALAPWVVPNAPRAALRPIGDQSGIRQPEVSLRAERRDRRPSVPRRPQSAGVRDRGPMSGLSLREAITAAATPALGADAATAQRAAGAARTPARRAGVVIVGAGLAGLSAASDLAARGHSAVALEARDRIGGRTLMNGAVRSGERVAAEVAREL